MNGKALLRRSRWGLKSNFLRIMNFILAMFANHKVCNILLLVVAALEWQVDPSSSLSGYLWHSHSSSEAVRGTFRTLGFGHPTKTVSYRMGLGRKLGPGVR